MQGRVSAGSLMEREGGGRLPSALDSFDPRCRVVCALLLAAALAFAQSFEALVPSIPPATALFFAGDRRDLIRSLRGLNVGGALVCILLPLTYGGGRAFGVFSVDGAALAVLILFKLNLIGIVLHRMVVSLGLGTVGEVLSAFGAPHKFRVLLLLTVRHIFLLRDGVVTSARAVSLRGGEMSMCLMLRGHAYMIATTLLHTSDRAERSLNAIRCRGGFAGFGGAASMDWRRRDTILCLLFLLDAAIILSGALWGAV